MLRPVRGLRVQGTVAATVLPVLCLVPGRRAAMFDTLGSGPVGTLHGKHPAPPHLAVSVGRVPLLHFVAQGDELPERLVSCAGGHSGVAKAKLLGQNKISESSSMNSKCQSSM